MSLLLEALKKAEKAKEEAQRRARAEPAAATELRLEGEAPAAAAPAANAEDSSPVRTRNELPDISQPLEIVSDDIGGAAPEARKAAPSASAAPSPAAKPKPAKSAPAQEP